MAFFYIKNKKKNIEMYVFQKILRRMKKTIYKFVTIYFRFKGSENLSYKREFNIFSLKALIILIFLSLNLSANLIAQERDIKFRHLTIEEGLSQSSIFSILQDSKGFMWFGTEDGLNKYDGYNFKVYKNNPENLNSLSYNYVKAIHEDQSGVLWIGTYGGGFNKFDREMEQFIYYQTDANNANSLTNNFVNSIYEDRSGMLWIGTENGLNKFDPKREQFTHYQTDPNDPNSLSNNKVMSIYEDRGGELWIGTEDGLNRFDREKELFIHYKHIPHDPNSLSNNVVREIFEDKLGVLWIGTAGGGLNKFDREKEKFIHYQTDPSNTNSLSNDRVMSIYEDKLGVLWIGTAGGGLNKFDRNKEQFIHFKADLHDPNSLSNNEVFSIYEDQSGVLWVGTDVGLNKFDREKKQFILYRSKPNDLNSLSHNVVYSIYEDQSGVLWIGTYGGGLNKFDRNKEQFIHFRTNPGNPNSLSSDWVRSFYEDRFGTIWVGTYGGGLNKFDREKEEFIHFKANPHDPNSLSNNVVRVIFEDRSGVFWIGTEDGLNKFDREMEQFTHYKTNPRDPNSLSNNFIYSIYEDRSGTLWIGTLDGLNKLVPSANEGSPPTFIHFKAHPHDPNNLSNSEVLTIYEDKSGVFWIGTPGGLNKFDRAKETFAYYMEKDGLPNDLIYDILEDSKGNLWLSTNKGISKFNPRTEKFRNYDVKDGLQSNEFSLGACHKSRTGEMFFGGINGFNSFYPETIKDNPHIPYVVITNFRIFNKVMPIQEEKDGKSLLTKSITETDKIELSYKDRVLTFEFAALQYALPEKNEYAYKMEGFEKDWNYVGNRRFATYTNLPPGDYVFRVKGSNNDGVWNEEGVSLKVTVIPPFWQTLWFRGFVIGAILLFLVTVYRIRTYTIRERTKQLEKRVEEHTGELKAANKELQQEILERKLAEEAVQTKKAYIDQLFESAQEAIVMTDIDGQVLRVNSEFTRLFGYTSDEAVGQLIDDLVSSGGLKKEAISYTKRLSEGRRMDFESVRRRKDGKLIHVSAIASPIVVGNEQVASYAIYRDITERKRAEEDVKRREVQATLIYEVGQRVSSELKLETLLSEIVTAVQEAFDYYGVMMLLLDEEAKRLTLKSITGGHADIMPKDLSVTPGEGLIGYAATTGETQISGDVSKDPRYMRQADEKTNSELAVPIKSGDKVIGVLDIQSDKFNVFDETDVTAMETLSTQIATAIENARLYEKAQREITERKRAEAQLNESLKEKEVLLKEIHHRVKNNMQIISSLLSLQAGRIKNKKMQEMFKVSQDRIKTMALIHEKLYHSKDLARIDFSDYIRSLTNNLFSIYRVGMEAINIKLDLDEFYLDINTGIPLGLIVNELISNSFKYAFHEERAWGEGGKSQGEIRISLRSDNEGRTKLVVRDNGVGFPKDLDFRKTKSLGLQLVNDLVEQIDGSIELQRRGGTAFKITFDAPKIKGLI